MEVLRILIWILGGIVVVALLMRVIRLSRLVGERIARYNAEERDAVERDPFSALAEVQNERESDSRPGGRRR